MWPLVTMVMTDYSHVTILAGLCCSYRGGCIVQEQQGEGSPTAGAAAARETELLSTIAELRAEAVQIRTANAERDEELVLPDDSFDPDFL